MSVHQVVAAAVKPFERSSHVVEKLVGNWMFMLGACVVALGLGVMLLRGAYTVKVQTGTTTIEISPPKVAVPGAGTVANR